MKNVPAMIYALVSVSVLFAFWMWALDVQVAALLPIQKFFIIILWALSCDVAFTRFVVLAERTKRMQKESDKI